MKICMTGLDDVQAPIELREQLSFTKSAAAELDRRMVELGCRGAVVLSTCNRTEVYLSLDEGQDLDPRALLCQAAGISSGWRVVAPTKRKSAGKPLSKISLI